MTIILAVRKNNETVIASDTRVTFDNEIIPEDNLAVEKISRVGDSLVGSSGWGLYDNILADYTRDRPGITLGDERSIFTFFMGLWQDLHKRYSLVNDQAGGAASPFGDLDAKFLIANSRGIFLVSSNMSVRKFNRYYAIGSGSSYGLGAIDVLYDSELDAEAIARRAVQTAMTFDNTCGGSIELKKA
jgi:ATP-dependent HslUV protease, peptidase subunit HslV